MSLLNETYYLKYYVDGASSYPEFATGYPTDPGADYYFFTSHSWGGSCNWNGYYYECTTNSLYLDISIGYGTYVNIDYGNPWSVDTDFVPIYSTSLSSFYYSSADPFYADVYYNRTINFGYNNVWFNGKKKLMIKFGWRRYDNLNNPLYDLPMNQWSPPEFYIADEWTKTNKMIGSSGQFKLYFVGTLDDVYLIGGLPSCPTSVSGIRRIENQDIGLKFLNKYGQIEKIGVTSYVSDNKLRINHMGSTYAISKTYSSGSNDWDSNLHYRDASGLYSMSKYEL